MIEVPLTEDALRTAISRIQDFVTVHDGKGDYGPALAVLRGSLGITEEILAEFTEWGETLLGDDSVGAPMLLGLIVGLIAADYG